MTKKSQASRRRKTSKENQASRRAMKLTRKECTHLTNLRNPILTTRSRRVNRLRVQLRISKIALKTKKRTSGHIQRLKSTKTSSNRSTMPCGRKEKRSERGVARKGKERRKSNEPAKRKELTSQNQQRLANIQLTPCYQRGGTTRSFRRRRRAKETLSKRYEVC